MTLCHPDDIEQYRKSSGWLSYSQYLIRMTYGYCRISSGWLKIMVYVIRMRWLIWSLSHPDDLAILSILSEWVMADALCHPDDLAGAGIWSGWVTANSLCHPDDIAFHLMSYGWLHWGWYLTRMSYGKVIMSPEWDTLRHLHEIAYFDFSQHAAALKRFRSTQPGKALAQVFEFIMWVKIMEIHPTEDMT